MLFPRPRSLAGPPRPLSSRRQDGQEINFTSEFQPDWVSPQVSRKCAKPGTTQRVLKNDNDTEITFRADRTQIAKE
jgi:hypothetical protein